MQLKMDMEPKQYRTEKNMGAHEYFEFRKNNKHLIKNCTCIPKKIGTPGFNTFHVEFKKMVLC